MKRLSSFIMLLHMTLSCQAQGLKPQTIEKNGMHLEWAFQGEWLHLTMQAPTRGWLAIGLNTSEGLAGTNLMMAAVQEAEVRLSDRYILAPGEHRSVEELGGVPSLILLEGRESAEQTSITFKMPVRASDRFHYNLEAGKKYHLLLAYSLEDDFMHHSIMRCAVEISL